MKNDLTTFEGLQREHEKVLEHNKRLLEAFETSDKAKIYRDGFEVARDAIRNFQSTSTWGPKATPEFAFQYGIETTKSVLDRDILPSLEKYNNTVESLQNQVEEYRVLLRSVFNLFKADNIAKEDLERFFELEIKVQAKLQFPTNTNEHLNFYETDEDTGED